MNYLVLSLGFSCCTFSNKNHGRLNVLKTKRHGANMQVGEEPFCLVLSFPYLRCFLNGKYILYVTLQCLVLNASTILMC